MQALDTHSGVDGLELTKRCFEHGILAIFAFNRQRTLQIMPPLVISAGEVDVVLERLEAAVTAMTCAPAPVAAAQRQRCAR